MRYVQGLYENERLRILLKQDISKFLVPRNLLVMLSEHERGVALSPPTGLEHITERYFHDESLGTCDITQAFHADNIGVFHHAEMRGAKRGWGGGVA